MNSFFEHHKDSIRWHYRCFDRIVLNGLIQPFQQPARVVGFFNTYRQVGTGGAVCTVVTQPPQATVVQCLLSAVFAEGEIVFGGVASFPQVGAVGHFRIVGGTDGFGKARGDATLIVLSTADVDSTFDLD